MENLKLKKVSSLFSLIILSSSENEPETEVQSGQKEVPFEFWDESGKWRGSLTLQFSLASKCTFWNLHRRRIQNGTRRSHLKNGGTFDEQTFYYQALD